MYMLNHCRCFPTCVQCEPYYLSCHVLPRLYYIALLPCPSFIPYHLNYFHTFAWLLFCIYFLCYQ
jgi:hypothetical protein